MQMELKPFTLNQHERERLDQQADLNSEKYTITETNT